ncbi:MAG: adenylate/guanylate cyclase domain-containing protein [Amphritea sp.]
MTSRGNMQCANCGFDNPADAKFCEQCGTRLVLACPHCGQDVSPGAKFCRECGASLTEPSAVVDIGRSPQTSPPVQYTPKHLATRIRAEQVALKARRGASGERKTITVLFADMTDSTALINDRDPEEASRLIDPILALMMDAVHHYEGYVAKSLGDGILALFGAPIACEDHAQRALYAALRMQDAMQRHSDRIRLEEGIPLQVRVGIHTGEVVVRSISTEDLHTDYDPVGHTVNIASRMEGIAAPGSILASGATYKLTEGYFKFKALGATQVKGVLEPLTVYEVLGTGPLRTRLQVAANRGLARFVGRQTELEQLQRVLDQTRIGRGQVVGMVGEPGVGKSRLFYEFKHRLQNECLVLETFSVSHGKAFAYMPLIELLKNYFQIIPQDNERRRREKVTGRVLTLDRSLEDSLPYVLYLLGVADSASPLPQMDPQIRRQRTFDATKRLLFCESLKQPLLIIFEDLQWLDRETEAFLDFLVEGVASARILLLVNYRPEYQHNRGQRSYYTQLRLDPLGQAEAEELLSTLLGDDPNLTQLKPQIMKQTEGNPFFLEEVVQTLVEAQVLSGGVGHYHLEMEPASLQIPATVQGVLSTRIDRLESAEKELLQTLAVIGKAFPWSLVHQVADLSEEELRSLLSRLQSREFIYEQPAFPEVEYTFKHGHTQEVAYGSLLLEHRRLLHERTAQALEALFSDSLEDHCGELAHHYSCSGNVPKAVQFLQQAGQQAAKRSANQDAITQLKAALKLLPTLPDTPERTHCELTLLAALGPALMVTRGMGSPEVEKTYTRALTLCRELGESTQLVPVLVGLRRFYTMKTDYKTAQELAEWLLRLASQDQDPALMLQAHYAMGATLFFQGELSLAQTHFEQSIRLYDPSQHRAHAFRYGTEPGILALNFMFWILWYRGFPDQALEKCEDVLALVREASPAHVLVEPMIFRTELHQLRNEGPQTQKWAETVMTLSTEEGLPYWLAAGSMLRGWALAEQGQYEAGIGQIREGLTAYEATGAESLRPYFLGLLAESLGRAGRIREALEELAKALALVNKSGERYYEAELHRLTGELQLLCPESGGAETAETYFEKAVAVASLQGARSLELRALVSLSRLRQQQGKVEESRQRLAEAYSAFTEGFDTPDLLAARELLAQLA